MIEFLLSSIIRNNGKNFFRKFLIENGRIFFTCNETFLRLLLPLRFPSSLHFASLRPQRTLVACRLAVNARLPDFD